jgi:hypothetical protein
MFGYAFYSTIPKYIEMRPLKYLAGAVLLGIALAWISTAHN